MVTHESRLRRHLGYRCPGISSRRVPSIHGGYFYKGIGNSRYDDKKKNPSPVALHPRGFHTHLEAHFCKTDRGQCLCIFSPAGFHPRGFHTQMEAFLQGDRGQYYSHDDNLSHMCCIAHKTKNDVRAITPNIIETGILSNSAPQNLFGSFNTLRSFTGVVLPTEASK